MLVVSLQVNIQSIWHEGRRLDQSRASAKQRELHAVQWLVQRMNRQQDHGPSRLEDMFGKQILARAIWSAIRASISKSNENPHASYNRTVWKHPACLCSFLWGWVAAEQSECPCCLSPRELSPWASELYPQAMEEGGLMNHVLSWPVWGASFTMYRHVSRMPWVKKTSQVWKYKSSRWVKVYPPLICSELVPELVTDFKQSCLLCIYTHHAGIADLSTLTNGVFVLGRFCDSDLICVTTRWCGAEPSQFDMCQIWEQAVLG